MKMLFDFWAFTLQLLTTTGLQILAIFGNFIIFGLILYLLSRYTRRLYVNVLGEKSDIYFTGWLGTPIHELGHALMCFPFMHKVTDIQLYKPNSEDGTLGYVNHAYNPRNPWALIGNFFIAMGPIIFGSIVIFLLVKFLLPNNQQILAALNSNAVILTTIDNVGIFFKQASTSTINIISALFNAENFRHWQFWLFLYICICVSAHMELSPPDLKGLWSGVVSIIVILLILNIIFILTGINGNAFLISIGKLTSLTTGIFTLAVVISALNCGLTFILLNIINLLTHKRFSI